MQQMTNRQKQAIETKNKLLNTSMELVRKHGFDSVSIQQICNASGVSIGAFYHHIKGKAGIVIEAYAQCDDYFEKEVMNHLEGENYLKKILYFIGCQMQYAQRMGIDLIIQIYKAQITDGNHFFLSEERGLTKGLFELVKKAQENNELIDEIPYKQIGKEILIVSRGVIYNWCQSEGNYDLVLLAKHMVENYLLSYKV